MSEKDDFIELLTHADLVTLHIGTHKIGLGRDLVAYLIEGVKLLPEPPPQPDRVGIEIDKDGMVQFIPPT
jgi:hypothetical protein